MALRLQGVRAGKLGALPAVAMAMEFEQKSSSAIR